MLFNYLKLATRLLLRNPFFSIINILGLSVGFAAFLVLWRYTSNELKTDQFHSDFKNKARVVFTFTERDDQGIVTEGTNGIFSRRFPKVFAAENPDFEKYTRLIHQSRFVIGSFKDHGRQIFLSHINPKHQKATFKEDNLAYADPNFFTFFSIPMVEGSPETVLKDPASIVISESMARKYFGNEKVVGRSLLLNDSIELKVTGVFKDLPHNTHLLFDALLSTQRIRDDDKLMGDPALLYFQLKSNSKRADLNKKLDASGKKFIAPMLAQANLDPNDVNFFFQPLEEIAFSKFSGDNHPYRSRVLLIALKIVALVILITGWINYLNLVIYANSKRMKELGVRKTSGARSIDFVFQFIVESTIINAISILGAVTLVQLVKIPLRDLFQVYLTSGDGISADGVAVIVLVTLTGILATGIYPAVMVMNKSTRNIFSGSHQYNFSLGKWLTVFQFSVAIVLMVSLFAIYNQISFILNKDLGLRRDEVIVMNLPENNDLYPKTNLETFLTRLSNLNGVIDFALSSSVPGDQSYNGICMQRSSGTEFISMDSNGGVDERFLQFFKIKLLAGRNFVNGDPMNKDAVIVSRILLQRLGIDQPEDAVGLSVFVEATEWTHDMKPATIIGVIEDYEHKPLLREQNGWTNEDGVALTYHDNVDKGNTPQKISMILSDKAFNETAKQVESLYKEIFPGSFFDWYFLDENVNKHYREEEIARNQITLFALLAVGIACLGLLGIIVNKAEEKTKEIGIRKVLGARMYQIAQVLLSTTSIQIAIAVLISVPVAHFLVQGYLQKFSERIALHWWHYATPVAALLIILMITVASTLRKAAKTNPVESLRYE